MWNLTQGFIREGQLLEPQEIDKMYVHLDIVYNTFLSFTLDATSQLLLFKGDMTLFAPYVW